MNPITCGMAADLLPLYLDGSCSADSRAALEAHMDACPACRAQYAQLRRDLTPAAAAAGVRSRRSCAYCARQAGQASMCASSAARLSALQEPSRYSGSRSAAMPQVIGFMSIPPFVR